MVEKLRENIEDQIMEAQIKLGFVKETMRFYYPLSSLRAICGTGDLNAEEMCRKLSDAFPEFSFQYMGERIGVRVPASYVEYIHKEKKAPVFLTRFIGLFLHNHHITLEQIREAFNESGGYACEKMPEDSDFDYVFYFLDPQVDEYYYCIRMEMGHTIYHRFLKSDYEQLMS